MIHDDLEETNKCYNHILGNDLSLIAKANQNHCGVDENNEGLCVFVWGLEQFLHCILYLKWY
jgi:hypothetical protein